MTKKKRILIVDDDASVVDYLVEMLEDAGYDAQGVVDPARALELAGAGRHDLVIADVEMPGLRGTELMEALHRARPGLLVILITAFGSIDLAVKAVRGGAADFVTKPFRIEVLLHAVERALHERRMRREIVRLRSRLPGASARGDAPVAESLAMRHILDVADRCAPTDATVLVTGESGCGKGMLAQRIHQRSPRAGKPFVQVNCAAIPATLLESELFGVCKGAFTDARADRAGLFVEADGGTLFLDELAETPLESQAKLLQVIESQRVRPVGGNKEIPVNVRLIAATNANLEEMLREGKFRPDLYYRLNIIRIDIPPLRSRPEDIETLVDACLQRACRKLGREVVGVSGEVMRWLLSHHWPGNVRELANVIERAVALTEHDTITMRDLALPTQPADGSADEGLQRALREKWTLDDLERHYIGQVLESTGGNKASAAALLGIDRRTLYRKLEQSAPRDPSTRSE